MVHHNHHHHQYVCGAEARRPQAPVVTMPTSRALRSGHEVAGHPDSQLQPIPPLVIAEAHGRLLVRGLDSGSPDSGGTTRCDLEERARLAFTPDAQLHWAKAHQTQQAVLNGRVTMEDFQ
eukprot:2259303-Amphidinium_carterae.1